MFSSKRRALTSAVLLLMLAACSGEAPQAPAAASADPADPAAAATVAPITDEAGLRAAAAKALGEQRFYAPAGNSALDHYLALRDMRPDDANLATALLELLPYAVIGIEQAVARQELGEARRLLGLLERADPQAPSLTRLRDSIVSAEASAETAAAEALAKAERDEAAKLAAEQSALSQAATANAAATAARATPAPLPAAPATPAAPAPTRPSPALTSTAVVSAPAAASPAASAAAPAAAAAPASAAGIPRLLSAPSPRYPIMAQRRKLEGQVVVQFTIQPDGSVAAPRVVSADPPGVFDEAAIVAASRWRFEAGSRSVPSSRVVQFRLAEAQR